METELTIPNGHHLVMVRHGESMGNVWPDAYRDDSTNFLSDLGCRQAEIAGIELHREQFKFTTIVTSALTRARQTAILIAQTMGDWRRNFMIEPDLNEWNRPHHIRDERQELPPETEVQHFQRVQNALIRCLNPLLQQGDVLCISHWYTMEALFDCLPHTEGWRKWAVPLDLAPISNGVPFVYTVGADRPLRHLNPYRSKPQY